MQGPKPVWPNPPSLRDRPPHECKRAGSANARPDPSSEDPLPAKMSKDPTSGRPGASPQSTSSTGRPEQTLSRTPNPSHSPRHRPRRSGRSPTSSPAAPPPAAGGSSCRGRPAPRATPRRRRPARRTARPSRRPPRPRNSCSSACLRPRERDCAETPPLVSPPSGRPHRIDEHRESSPEAAQTLFLIFHRPWLDISPKCALLHTALTLKVVENSKGLLCFPNHLQGQLSMQKRKSRRNAPPWAEEKQKNAQTWFVSGAGQRRPPNNVKIKSPATHTLTKWLKQKSPAAPTQVER